MNGNDLDPAAKMRKALRIPLGVLGGADFHYHIPRLLTECGVLDCSAGSLFVFKGRYRAVLINYLNPVQRDEICRSGLFSNPQR